MALTTQVFDGKGILENYMQSANNFMAAVHGFGQQKLAERTQDNYDRISDQNERKLQDELTGNAETRNLNRFAIGTAYLTARRKSEDDARTLGRELYDTESKVAELSSKAKRTADEDALLSKAKERVGYLSSNKGKLGDRLFDYVNDYHKSFLNLLSGYSENDKKAFGNLSAPVRSDFNY